MKKILKMVIVNLGVLALIPIVSTGQTKWAPIIMGDITTFVPYKKSTTTPPPEPIDTSIKLTSGQAQTNIADKGTYVHYKIYAHAGDVVKVDVYDMDANGNLYIKMGSPASVNNYDKKSENGGQTHSTQSESSTITANSDGYIYIAVHAPTYGCYTNVEHKIMAYIGNYGDMGPFSVSTLDSHGTRSYYPDGLKKTPIIIFLPGWNDTKLDGHAELLRHIASQGYTVILKPVNKRFGVDFKNVLDVIKENKEDLDTSRVGVIGWSHGGGISYSMMRDLIKEGYGTKGRFLMPIEPMFAIDMNKDYLSKLTNMNFLMVSFHSFEPDVRTMFMEYSLLSGENVDKNYINLEIGKGNHGYLNKMKKDFLNPLGALIAYTFKNDKKAKVYALDGAGKYNPRNIEEMLPSDEYREQCSYPDNLDKDVTMKVENDIDYCEEVY